MMLLDHYISTLIYRYEHRPEEKCHAIKKNTTGKLQCPDDKSIVIKQMGFSNNNCSSDAFVNPRNLSLLNNITCNRSICKLPFNYKRYNFLNIDCLSLKSNTTSEIACRTDMVIEIYDVWITQVHGYCPGYKQTHKNHTFNSYVPMKRTYSKKCNWKSRCEIYSRNLLRTTSVYYQCRDGEYALDLENGTSRKGMRRTVHNKNKKTYEQSEVPQEHQNGNQNIGISNSAYTDLVSSIEYSYDIPSAEPDSSDEHSEVSNKHQNGNQDNDISNLTYIELVSSIEYSYAIPSAEPDSLVEQCEVPKEHQNGIKNNAISNSPYETPSSIEYSYAMTRAEPDFITEQSEVTNKHQNGNKNNAISNSPYEMASSIEYSYDMTSAEPDSIFVKNPSGSNEHLYVKGNRTTGKPSFDIESSISSTYSHLKDADAGSDITYDHTSHTRVQGSPESDYNVSCNRISEDEYNIAENYNVSYHKTSDYN
ncbi:unnamed protein product [Mytilus coruscus]|uniref:SUEL-type lectin domain-containing protein n=1 Tax=Mytilus coruscus TaxID=42192 RepID=A0A6J8D1L1_MYTCO|nr:unnamed protein product [Mytilus coruscus]